MIYQRTKYLFVSNILCWPFFFVKYFEYYHCELLMALDWISLITISQNSGKHDIKINTLILSSKFVSTWLGWHVIIIVTRAQIFTTLKGRNYKEYKVNSRNWSKSTSIDHLWHSTTQMRVTFFYFSTILDPLVYWPYKMETWSFQCLK